MMNLLISFFSLNKVFIIFAQFKRCKNQLNINVVTIRLSKLVNLFA